MIKSLWINNFEFIVDNKNTVNICAENIFNLSDCLNDNINKDNNKNIKCHRNKGK